MAFLFPDYQHITWHRNAPVPDVAFINVGGVSEQNYNCTFQFDYPDNAANWLTTPLILNEIPWNPEGMNLPLSLQYLDNIPNGTYRCVISVIIGTVMEPAVMKTSLVELTVGDEQPEEPTITTDKNVYNVIYNRVTNSLSGETTVQIINNPSGDVIFETIGSLFLEKTTSENTFTLEEDPAFPFAINFELPNSGNHIVNCRLKKDGVYVKTFQISVVVIATEDITVDPGGFEFFLRKGLNETKSAVMTLINPMNKAFTIEPSSLITVSQNSGNTSADITIATINSEIIDVGSNSGSIIIRYDGKEIVVPINITVIAFSGINLMPYNFCLDDIILDVYKYYENARFIRVTLDMEIGSAYNGIENSSALYLIPYFEDRVKTDIGRKIQNYFHHFKVPLFENIGGFNNELVYKPILAQIKIEEIDMDYQVLHSTTISNVKFFAGHRPALFPLFSNFGMRRKYKDSVHFFSYFTGLVSPEDFTGVPTADNPAGNFEIHAVALQESEVSYQELATKFNLNFLDFPEQQKKVVLQWLNNNLVPEWFVFSGDYKITTEFDHSYDNVMIRGEKYDTKDLAKLTINTGFILREEKDLVKEIIRSLSSFIKIEDEVFNCFSITQKLVEKDSTEDLISFDLEFLIVKNGN